MLRSRVFVALHMHAGDGNVHTNLPVNSDDYAMLQEANAAVARIMALARSLGGVISGEHGIGITKLEYLTAGRARAVRRATRRRSTPRAASTRASCWPARTSPRAYTPSFSLIGHESLILEASEIGAVADSIKDCLRCGKCKPVCATHVPRANLLYSPRNKILAASLLIEAFLYEEQTRRGVSLRHFDEFSDVADHCTVCHKCAAPCPVDIDFGDVSIAMRNLLRQEGKRPFRPATAAAMFFLNATDPTTIQVAQARADRLGVSRAASGARRRAAPRAHAGTDEAPAGHGGHAGAPGAGDPLHQQADAGRTAQAHVARAARHRGRRDRPDHPRSRARRRGFRRGVLFPGVRLGAAVLAGRARDAGDALARRRADGAAAGLPVLRLSADGGRADEDRGRRIITANRVLFHRVANTLNYLDIKTVIVSCGTCMDQLEKYEFGEIFPGCRLLDIHEYLLEKGVRLDGVDGRALHVSRPVPHADEDLCAARRRQRLDGRAGGAERALLRRVGDAGDDAAGHLDAGPLPQGGGDEGGRRGAARRTASRGAVKVLTSCPSCLQGLSRFDGDAATTADYIVVEMARRLLGPDWMAEYVANANRGGIERVLV